MGFKVFEEEYFRVRVLIGFRRFLQGGKDTIWPLAVCYRILKQKCSSLLCLFVGGFPGFASGGPRYNFYTPKNSNPLDPGTLKMLLRWTLDFRGFLVLLDLTVFIVMSLLFWSCL